MTSPAHPSSSLFGHSTPALTHRFANLDASSSSPPTDVIATPSDRYAAPSRARNGKQQPRRSVRIRTSSGGHLDSSPQIKLGAPSSYLGEDDASHVFEIPSRTRAVRTDSAWQNEARSAAPARLLDPQTPEDALALAQAHGITPDQFEQAKQQVMRFLRSEHGQAAPGSAPLVVNTSMPRVAQQPVATPTYPSAGAPFPPSSTTQSFPQQPLSRTPTASAALQAAFQLDLPFTTSRPRARAPVEDAVSQSAKRQRRDAGPAAAAPSSAAELAVRQWAQEESSSSSEDDAPGLASMLISRRVGATPGGSAGSPSAAALSPALGAAAPDANASPSLAGQRGMMDRFMSSQPLPAAATAPAPQLDAQGAVEQAHQHHVSPSLAPASPKRKAPMSYAEHALLSPAPSRPKTSILFSPDVARLLRSELDELEANELTTRHSSLSPRKDIDRSSDIVVDSSPFRGGASPFSSGGASRSRDIFSTSNEPSLTKRARWNSAFVENRPTSPTPSAASLTMRAPSFCDSSPAASDRGSATSRQHSFVNHADTHAHPASAPDFMYGGMPSSSPTSSQHSEYVPARYSRSSPGPGPKPKGAPARSDTSTTVGDAVAPAPSARKKRAPARRNDSAPSSSSRGLWVDEDGEPIKPRYSYAALIGQALFSTPDLRMALADIYVWIMSEYPYFKKDDAGWQNSIRHNLSLNQCFIKTARGPDNPGKGCLWAIKPGTEDQFVDGDFVRKGGQGNSRRKGAGATKAAQAATKLAPQKLLRGDDAVPAAPAPTAASAMRPPPVQQRPSTPSALSSRSDSPAASVMSRTTSSSTYKLGQQHHQPQNQSQQAYSPCPSTASMRSVTPVAASPVVQPTMQLEPPVELSFSVPPAALGPRPASAAAMHQYEPEEQQQLAPPAPAPLSRSHSSMGFLEPAAAAACASANRNGALEAIEEEASRPHLAPPVALGRTYSAPMLATQSEPGLTSGPPPASPPPSHLTVQRLHEPLLSATMSPPTSVYHRLAGPYQPLSYGSSLAQNHRALALLASPEAAGIMTSRGGSPRLVVPSSSTPFLPPLGGRKRQRTESDNRMLSPTALVHTQSPISSIRGGPRQPMSPMQDKLEPLADPAKKLDTRAPGTRLLPSVNALVSADFDPFRSPPPSSSSSAAHVLASNSARYHLRSPSARLQAVLSTPGGHGKGSARHQLPLGFSPSLASGSSWERSTADSGVGVGGASGGSTPWGDVGLGESPRIEGVGAQRLYWPSPGAGSGAAHLPW
ncbi:uncharacterized protein RHOBADRAFT_50588 [Rhodotorula graminis WP1]|uniref:Fork-head domain-containing protein n=1 Tax=Rhodotorula graminis (strain WP1) TaxID=578459 RepID=A0A194SCA1_RHOGW|nr:uncharacterized protein RHOBADRAFT_50588 [Rhodotorula graminis WP1]KPV78075.1 hypothetical protein RHOBADRAFT_50588 [Rhodotorula graminis WP1]